jgi:hypothetical protein
VWQPASAAFGPKYPRLQAHGEKNKYVYENPPKICEIPIIRQDQVYYGFLFPKTKYISSAIHVHEESESLAAAAAKKNSVPFVVQRKTYILTFACEQNK